MPASEGHVIPASAVGQSLGTMQTNVTLRRTVAYAAGIGATRPGYYSDPPIVPPGFIVSLEWPLLDGGAYRDLLGASQAAMERAIHLQQTSSFHRPITPGVELSTSAMLRTMRRARRGAIVSVELMTTTTSGTPLVESEFVVLFLDAHLSEGLDTDTAAARSDALGAAAWLARRDVALGTAHAYTECSGIWNPIHTEPAAAHRAGLAQPIVHGTWTWAVAMEQAIDWWCAGDPQRLARWSGRFVSPIVPGEPIELRGALSGKKLRIDVRQADRLCMQASGALR